MDTAYCVSPIPIPPNPIVAMRIRLFGETSCANAEAAGVAPVSRKRLLVDMHGHCSARRAALLRRAKRATQPRPPPPASRLPPALPPGCTIVPIMERRRFLQGSLAGLALSAARGYSEEFA